MFDEQPQSQEQRKLVRKTLRTRGTYVVNGESMPFSSIDIGLGGVCVVFAQQMKIGQTGRINLSFLVNGRKQEVSSAAKVCYCVCGRDGFRVGVQFTEALDQASSLSINMLLKSS